MNNLNFAKKLRKNMTPHEHKLWYHLRAKRFNGEKFKRQVIIDKYIVDFISFKQRIIIELDSSQHLDIDKQIEDKIRDEYFKSEGFKILRFNNDEINNNIEGVMEIIGQNFK